MYMNITIGTTADETNSSGEISSSVWEQVHPRGLYECRNTEKNHITITYIDVLYQVMYMYILQLLP